jgi:hypothetical protein
MENTTTERMMMTVNVKDVSDKSSCIGYIGFGTWFDGKDFMVAQYQANPTQWYFFVYDNLQNPESLIHGHLEGFSYGNEVWQMNPINGNFYGTTFIYNSQQDKMLYQKQKFDFYHEVKTPPSFLFEIS